MSFQRLTLLVWSHIIFYYLLVLFTWRLVSGSLAPFSWIGCFSSRFPEYLLWWLFYNLLNKWMCVGGSDQTNCLIHSTVLQSSCVGRSPITSPLVIYDSLGIGILPTCLCSIFIWDKLTAFGCHIKVRVRALHEEISHFNCKAVKERPFSWEALVFVCSWWTVHHSHINSLLLKDYNSYCYLWLQVGLCS